MKSVTVLLLFIPYLFNAQVALTEKMEPFYVAGIATTTTNENAKSTADLGELWGSFNSENVSNSIPDQVSDAV